MIRELDIYSRYKEEQEYIENLFTNEELTPEEEPTLANFNRQKTALELQINNKQRMIEKLQKEIEDLKKRINVIDQNIARLKL